MTILELVVIIEVYVNNLLNYIDISDETLTAIRDAFIDMNTNTQLLILIALGFTVVSIRVSIAIGIDTTKYKSKPLEMNYSIQEGFNIL